VRDGRRPFQPDHLALLESLLVSLVQHR
jgi:hypothetical protein